MTKEKIMFADILPATRLAVTKPQIFTYGVPEYWASSLKIGQAVEIPFRFGSCQGIVVNIKKTLPKNFRVKDLFRIIDPLPYFSPDQIKLSKFLANYYFVSQGLIAKTMLPPFRKKGKSRKEPLPDFKINVKPSAHDKKQAEKVLKSTKKEYLVSQENSFGLILELIKKTNGQILILQPEINNCLFLENYLKNNLKTPKIVALHSNLSEGEYFENWQKVFKGEAKIIIGTRATVFTPCKNLDLIIVDKEHDSSFKQWDMNPRYHARLAAQKLNQLKNSKLVMISSSPSIETYAKVEAKKIELLESKPESNKIQVVDMRDERKKGNYSVFSEKLEENLKKIIKVKGQALLFINRKGSAGAILCQDCGYIAKCPHCKVSLVFHENSVSLGFKTQANLACHHCNHTENVPLFCPKCKGPEIKFLGSGTQKIITEIKKKWPGIKVARLDLNIKNFKKSFWQILKDWQDKKIDILVGTQVLTKLPQGLKADLVGLLNVDAMLHIPHFRQAETSWQLLNSVLQYGEQGLIQTYSPENKVIKTVALGDYKKFVTQESKNRQDFNYPPFGHLVKLIYKNEIKSELEKEVKKIADKLKKEASEGIQIYGPLTPIIAKERNKFVAEILLKFNLLSFEDKNKILELVPKTRGWIIDVDPL